jgi:hypothetical protein
MNPLCQAGCICRSKANNCLDSITVLCSLVEDDHGLYYTLCVFAIVRYVPFF